MTSKITDLHNKYCLPIKIGSFFSAMIITAGLLFIPKNNSVSYQDNTERELCLPEYAKPLVLETAWSKYADSLKALSSVEERKALYCHSPTDATDLCQVTRYDYEQLKFKAWEKASQLKDISANPDLVDRLIGEVK